MRTSERRQRGQVARTIAMGVIAAGLLASIATAGSGTAGASSYQIEIRPASGLADGQAFTVRVTGPPGMTVLNSGFCDPDMPDPTSQDDLTEWCTDTIGNGSAGGLAPADPSGVAELTIRAGTGAATKTSPALGTTHSWTCDRTSPCKLPLVISLPGSKSVFDVSTLLTYRDDDPTAGCIGAASVDLPSSAPDRLTEQWAAWTVRQCAGGPKATTASFENDGRATSEFADGSVDLAYTAVPPGTAGFGPATRPAVATPVALNATVLAAAGYYPSTSSVAGVRLWRHIDHVDMTYQEAAALLSGHLTLDEDLQNSLIARNPELASQTGAIGFTLPGGLAGPQATTQFASSLLAKTQAAGWAYPKSASKYGEHAGQPLGAFGDYNSLFNSLAMVDLATGKPQIVGDMYRKLAEKPEAVSLVTFYLTDLATARQLGLAPVALGNGTGPFVAPTEASLTAAAPSLQVDANGFSTPATSGQAAGAYPLTFVEQAISPATTILDATCKPKAGTAAAIKAWLSYVTDAGQDPAALADAGLVPLTPALRSAAKASLAKIGASAPTTGPCAPATSTTTTTSTTAVPTADGTLPDGSIPGTDIPLGPDGLPNSSLDAASGSTAEVGAVRRSDPQSVARAAHDASRKGIPALVGPLRSPVVAASLALPALIGLASANGWLSTGRPLPRRRRWTGPPDLPGAP